MTDEYNGWRNRETWALQCWLTNEQELYTMVRDRAITASMHYRSNARADLATRTGEANYIASEIKTLWGEITDENEAVLNLQAILTMVRDIGSEYRVAWDEIGAAWLADVSES